jgi:hypothetical protein
MTVGRNIRLRLKLNQLWDIRQPIRTLAEDCTRHRVRTLAEHIVRVRYEQTASEKHTDKT